MRSRFKNFAFLFLLLHLFCLLCFFLLFQNNRLLQISKWFHWPHTCKFLHLLVSNLLSSLLVFLNKLRKHFDTFALHMS